MFWQCTLTRDASLYVLIACPPLQALFRVVAMVVPDFALIAEIRLYSAGYSSAQQLAQKIVTVFRLSSEQLSGQAHYDYGMRAVGAVLASAASLLRAYPTTPESVLVIKALKDVNIAKFVSADVPLFHAIVGDVFPVEGSITAPASGPALLGPAIIAAAVAIGLEPTEALTTKVLQCYEMLSVRHGVMVVGRPFAGKSSVLQVLALALSHCAVAAPVSAELPVVMYPINPLVRAREGALLLCMCVCVCVCSSLPVPFSLPCRPCRSRSCMASTMRLLACGMTACSQSSSAPVPPPRRGMPTRAQCPRWTRRRIATTAPTLVTRRRRWWSPSPRRTS